MPIAVCRKVLNQASLLAPFEIPTLQSTSKAAGDERAVCRSLSENPREELQLLAQAVWIQVPGIRGMQFRSKRRLLGATARQPTRKRIWQKFMQFVQVSLRCGAPSGSLEAQDSPELRTCCLTKNGRSGCPFTSG